MNFVNKIYIKTKNLKIIIFQKKNVITEKDNVFFNIEIKKISKSMVVKIDKRFFGS